MKEAEVQVTLTVIEGDDKGNSVRLSEEQTIIGRKDCDLVLNDRKVSHQHAAIEISGSEVTIVDLESRNGIYVNGKKVSRVRLSNLDELQVGLSKVRVLIVDDLANFKKRNVKPPQHDKTEPSQIQSKGKAGRRDIGSMINDELKQFSKWDVGVDPEPSGSESDISGYGFLLEVLEGPDAGKQFRVQREATTLGRGKADVPFRDSDISRVHATIDVFGKGHAVIRDLGSTNGTFVNKKRISEVRLKDGDRVQVGGTLLRFVIED